MEDKERRTDKDRRTSARRNRLGPIYKGQERRIMPNRRAQERRKDSD